MLFNSSKRHSNFNLKRGTNDELTDFIPPLILNFWTTFFKYFFYVKLTLLPFRSRSISMPSTSSLHSYLSSRIRKTSLFSVYQLQIFFWKRWSYRLHTAVDRCTLYLVPYCNIHIGRNGFMCTSCLLWNCRNACTTALGIALNHITIFSAYIPYSLFL